MEWWSDGALARRGAKKKYPELTQNWKLLHQLPCFEQTKRGFQYTRPAKSQFIRTSMIPGAGLMIADF